MLTVTIELVPAGFTPLRRTIATMRIANISDLSDISDYWVDAMEGANPLAGTAPRVAECTVTDHARAQSIWALLQKACGEILKADFVEL